MMRINLIVIFSIFLLFLLQACSDKFHNSNPEEITVGWRSAGISWPDAVNTGGAFELAAVGDHLFVLDSYTPRADNGSDTRPRRWRIWEGAVGSENWQVLSFVHESCRPEEMHAFNGFLYVSSLCRISTDSSVTQYEGLWQYSTTEQRWTQILKAKQGLMDSLGSRLAIGTIGNYLGELAVTVGDETGKCKYWLGGVNDAVGRLLPCPGKKNSIWRMDFQELNGKLYAMSSDNGIFRYTEGAASWDSLSSPRGRDSYEIESVASITAHDGHLIVGYERNYMYNSGIYRLEKDDSWTQLTPKYMYQDSVAVSDAMESTDALLSYRGWLIAGGSRQSYPRFWVPLDSARPQFGDWRIAFDNWTDLVGNYESYPRTYDLLGVGDTLYAAARTMVLKIPLAEIPEIWGYKYNAGMYPHLQDSLSRMGK